MKNNLLCKKQLTVSVGTESNPEYQLEIWRYSEKTNVQM